jgi:SAM-dependent methyltransferase
VARTALTGRRLLRDSFRLPRVEAGDPSETAGVDWRGLNRANWDDRVPVHLASEFYDLAGFRAGRDSLRPFELAEAGDVSGKRLLHLQYHIGLDTLSWARHGALASGLDFSVPAIEAARSLAAELRIPASFLASDVYSAVAALDGQRFDIVYASIGSLVWLPDIPRWAHTVAALLAPGGFLYLVDGHPFAQILDSATGTVVTDDYFDDAPQVTDWPWSYTGRSSPLAHQRNVQFQHTVGQIITAIAEAGLCIEFLHEHDFDEFQRFDSLQRQADGSYRLPPGRPRIPMLLSLRASRPGQPSPARPTTPTVES